MKTFSVRRVSAFLLVIVSALAAYSCALAEQWKREWPHTDFSKSSIGFDEIMSGGPAKDGIQAIDSPRFKHVSEVRNLGAKEPVISVDYNEEAKAYPLRVLMFHEIANDEIGGMPITITYCPLCNAGIVFDRRLDGKILDFGVSGKLRHSDMIMYDRQTESWWQQFLGLGIVGDMTGKTLKKIPSRIVPFGKFKKTYPDGLVLVPDNSWIQRYGTNPYVKYDSSKRPFLYRGNYKGPVPALAYVIAVEKEAWSLTLLRKKGDIRHNDLLLRWHEGMNSALDKKQIDQGRDIGYVTVQRLLPDGSMEDIVYDMTFAFTFMAFHPNGEIRSE